MTDSRYKLGDVLVFRGTSDVGVVIASRPSGDSFTYEVELPKYQSWAHDACRPATAEEREKVRTTGLREALIDVFVDRHITYPLRNYSLGPECSSAILPFERAIREELGSLDLDDLRRLNSTENVQFFSSSPHLKKVESRLFDRQVIVKAIAQAEHEGLYDVSEHLSGAESGDE